MEIFIRVIPMIAYQLFMMLLQPLFWIVIGLIWFQFNRVAKMKSKFFQVPVENVWGDTFRAILLGLFGGFIGSIVLVATGVSIMEIGIEYLWLLALFLMLINQRFMCFAYAGGILGIVEYFFGWPDINIGQLMTLVAVLHFVEAVLILLSGHLGAMPIYVKGKQGRIVGGFNMMRFWPLPIVAMMATVVSSDPQVSMEIMKMPEWWPIIPSEYLRESIHNNIVYSLVPVVAGLGYSDLALTTEPQKKTLTSAKNLGLYSIVLLALALLAGKEPKLAILAAVFAPLGHELIIRIGQKQELVGEYIYQQPSRGVMILDTIRNYPACRGGLKSGDIIIRVGSWEIQSPQDFEEALEQIEGKFTIRYMRKGKWGKANLYRKHSWESLGIILVPNPIGGEYWDVCNNSSIVQKLIRRLRKKGNRWFLGRKM